jgi:hypothetical protein
LGAFLAALNRWVNSVYDSEFHNLRYEDRGADRNYYSPLNQEPRAVRLEVAQVQNGSVIIDTVVRYLDGQIVTTAFLTGLLTNAAYDVLKGHLRRAQRRVMYGDQAMVEPSRHIHLNISLNTFDSNGQPFVYEREIIVTPDAQVHTLPPDEAP